MFIYLSLMALSLFMLTFSIGYMPKTFEHQRLLQLFQAFGVGSLLGITLMILLPESVCTILDASLATSTTATLPKATGIHVGLALTSGFVVMLLVEEVITNVLGQRRTMPDYLELGPVGQQEQALCGLKVRTTTTAMCTHSIAEGLAIAATLFSKSK